MRAVIGWMAAMLASALLGAAVYQTVLSKPLPQLATTATVETINADPNPGPTLNRTEARTVVDPTPTVTVDDEVLIDEPVVPVSQPRTATPAPARTSAPKPQATDDRDDESNEATAEAAEDPADDHSGEGSEVN